MRLFIPFFFSSLLLFGQVRYANLVNPFVGTDGHGHTFPGATTPFGMVQLSPDTRVEGWDACGGYHYSDSIILGFTHTHLSGTGVPDYGDMLFMPMSKQPSLHPNSYRSSFSHQNEKASAGYYQVLLQDDSINVELTATTRVGIHRYRFPKRDSAYVIIDLHHGLGPDVVIDSWMQKNGRTEISGFRRSKGWAQDQHLYFVAQFSLPIQNMSVVNNDSIVWNSTVAKGNNVKGSLLFNTRKNNELIIKVALSSVSVDGARKNLLTEAEEWNFEMLLKQTQKQWNDELGRINVSGGTLTQQRTFYTALYHCMIAPNTFSDVDGKYRGMNGVVQTARDRTHYTVFSLWDTFRALHPLLSIIDSKRVTDFINTFLVQYDESGLLPVWELCSNETYCMIGYHSVSVIADAIAKNISGFDRNKALQAMVNSAEKNHFGLNSYRTNGYVLGEKESESVSKTLEYAYDDWCIGRTAELLGNNDLAQKYFIRSQNYNNVFDPRVGFMRGKKNGMWNESFTPASVSLDFTEANSWQYSFFIPHDINGMIELYGGQTPFINKLDELFSTTSKLEGRQQSDITGLIGQYAHGNEPSHHMAYLFTYAGAQEKTQERIRQILTEMYTDKPDGLCGNEDCGQMSAWYVMSAMGLYQVTPGNPEYVLASSLFDSVTIRLENGRQIRISTKKSSSNDRYIQSVQMNGKELNELFISHIDIVSGSTLTITVDSNPSQRFNKQKHVTTIGNVPFTAVPYFSSKGLSFRESTIVEIFSPEKGSTIFYTIDGSIPTAASTPYHNPITVKENTTIQAVAVQNNISSAPAKVLFVKSTSIGTISLATRYSDQYTAGGDDALIDGIFGVEDFRVGHWQGYEQSDLNATVDLGSVKNVERITTRFLQDNNAWIFFPTHIDYEISSDGITFENVFSGSIGIPPEQNGAIIKPVHQTVTKQTRYIRIRAKNIGTCPPWHKGSGQKAWLFADEIEIR